MQDHGLARHLDRAACWLLAAVLFWAPIPLGSNHAHGPVVLAAGAALAMIPWLLGRLAGGPWPRVEPAVLVALAAAAGALGWAVLQTQPVAALPSPLDHAAHPVLATLSGMGHAVQETIALDPARGWREIGKLAGYLLAAALAYALGQNRRQARLLVAVMVATITLNAAYGIAELGIGKNPRLPDGTWQPYWSSATGTFVNRNSFATYAGLGVLLATAMLLRGILDRRELERNAAGKVLSELLERRALWLMALVATACGLLLSTSRGGVLSTTAALLAVFGIVASLRRQGRVAVLVLLTLGVLVGAAAGSGVLERLDVDAALRDLRPVIWAETIKLIERRPLLGHGIGSFEPAFALLARRVAGPFVVDKAHNSYLDAAAELGIPAAMALAAAPAILTLTCAAGLRRRGHDRAFPLAGLACGILVGLHALVDFSIQIPAVGFTFMVVLGIGAAQSLPGAPRRPSTARGGAAGRQAAAPECMRGVADDQGERAFERGVHRLPADADPFHADMGHAHAERPRPQGCDDLGHGGKGAAARAQGGVEGLERGEVLVGHRFVGQRPQAPGRLQLGRVGREKLQHDAVRHDEPVADVPAGLIQNQDDQLPDEQVQAVIRLVFELFERRRSIPGVLLYLVEHDIRLPDRVRSGPDKGEIRWNRPNQTTLQDMLRHPGYAGAVRPESPEAITPGFWRRKA